LFFLVFFFFLKTTLKKKSSRVFPPGRLGGGGGGGGGEDFQNFLPDIKRALLGGSFNCYESGFKQHLFLLKRAM